MPDFNTKICVQESKTTNKTIDQIFTFSQVINLSDSPVKHIQTSHNEKLHNLSYDEELRTSNATQQTKTVNLKLRQETNQRKESQQQIQHEEQEQSQISLQTLPNIRLRKKRNFLNQENITLNVETTLSLPKSDQVLSGIAETVNSKTYDTTSYSVIEIPKIIPLAQEGQVSVDIVVLTTPDSINAKYLQNEEQTISKLLLETTTISEISDKTLEQNIQNEELLSKITNKNL